MKLKLGDLVMSSGFKEGYAIGWIIEIKTNGYYLVQWNDRACIDAHAANDIKYFRSMYLRIRKHLNL